MRKFLKNSCLFGIPFFILACFVGFFYYVGYPTGEFTDIDKSIVAQRETDGSLLGLAYNEQNSYYKKTNANYYRADVIALGTSRVMQIRKEYFADSFYNCGGGAYNNFDSYINFLENLQYKPKLMVLGIDYWVFNDKWNRGLGKYDSHAEITKNNKDPLVVVKGFGIDFMRKKWSFSSLNAFPDNIGVSGKVRGNGFRNDGSYCYGDMYRNPEKQPDYEFSDTRNRIKNEILGFVYGDEIYAESVRMLDDLLRYCKDNDIAVVGFTAPLAPSIYEEMVQLGKYGYLNGISPACEDVFNRYGYSFFDFLDGGMLDLGDAYYLDGFHGGDVVYASIMQRMCDTDDALKSTIDEEALQKIIDESVGRISFDFE